MTETVQRRMGTMGEKGDTRITWDKDNPDDVDGARAHFTHMTNRPSEGGKGYLAYTATGPDATVGEQITEFDPELERIILVPQSAGG